MKNSFLEHINILESLEIFFYPLEKSPEHLENFPEILKSFPGNMNLFCNEKHLLNTCYILERLDKFQMHCTLRTSSEKCGEL